MDKEKEEKEEAEEDDELEDVEGRRPDLLRGILGAAIILLFIVAVAALICWFLQSNQNMHQALWIFLVVALVLTGVVGLVIGAIAIIRHLEQRQLFQPSRVLNYSGMPAHEWLPLKSGGGLMHYTPQAVDDARPVLFLHGNTLSLQEYNIALRRLAELRYDVYAVEYAGYGATIGNDDAPNAETVVQDVREAWDACGSDEAIVIGFSLGGAVLGECYDELEPLPAQIVFLNTFPNFPSLVSDKVGSALGSLAAPVLKTQWSTKPPRKFEGKVLIVYTKDDSVVPAKNAKQLCKIFRPLNPDCIELESGGHRYSAMQYQSRWASPEHLLPAISPVPVMV